MKTKYTALLSLFAVLILTCNVRAFAQFTVLNGEKSSTKWTRTLTGNYMVIYPEGEDSLGMRFANLLEYYRRPVGFTAGYLPNQQFANPMPIVLHTHNATSNGAVIMAPRRMEIFTFPEAYSATPPVSWERLLAIHENRHVAQMQFAASGFWTWFKKPFGEMAPLFIESLHMNMALAEGDAVVAETALTNSGRGRTADFLSYIRMAFDNGDTRNWFRWRYGSQCRYTPDHYRVGYMTVAGARYLYDAPMFMSEYLHKSSYPFRFNAMASTLKDFSGKKFKKTWDEITNAFSDIWKADDLARGPFQTIETVSKDRSRFYSVLKGAVETANGKVYAVHAALDKATELVEVQPDGSLKHIRAFNAASKLAYSPYTDCIYWSETVPDVRWEMYESSRIRMIKPGKSSISDFTADGRYVNPAVSADGRLLAAADYSVPGQTGLVLFSLEDGRELRSIKSLPGLQITELAFQGDEIVFTGISDEGMGLYMTDFNGIRILENPVPFKLSDMIAHDGVIYFTSDKNGTQEIYSYQGGVMKQLTNTKYGVSGPFFRNGELHFIALTPQGKVISRANEEFGKTVAYADRASYPIADTLTAQESRFHYNPGNSVRLYTENYNKTAHAFNIHSWVPIYINRQGVVGSMSGYGFENASLGAMAYFQNLTSTLDGSMGLSLHVNPFEAMESDEKDDQGNPVVPLSAWTAGFHLNMNYTGLFPVFNLTLDIGDRPSAKVVQGIDPNNDSVYVASARSDNKLPYIGGSLTMSFPLNFSHGGWNRMLKPFVGVLASTDRLADSYYKIKYNETWGVYEPDEALTYGFHRNIRFIAGAMGGVELPVPQSAIYPRLGVGGGFQYSSNMLSDRLYATVYGYLPGITSTSGLKLTASTQIKTKDKYPDIWGFDTYDMAPRGFDAIYMMDEAFKFSADYAIPILPIDLAIWQYAYIRNLDFIPFADYSVLRNIMINDDLYSVGAELLFRFEKLLFLSNTLKMGVRGSYNGGSLYDRLGMDNRYSFRFVIGADI